MLLHVHHSSVNEFHLYETVATHLQRAREKWNNEICYGNYDRKTRRANRLLHPTRD